MRPIEQQQQIDAVHRLYYEHVDETWNATRWLGHQALKCPLDLWVYQEILAEVRPSLVIETGTRYGGSTLFLACVLEALGHGKVVSIDIAPVATPPHPRARYIIGGSTDPAIVEQVRGHVGPDDRVLVILDSDHHRDHVAAELAIYTPMVTAGSYCIVEDTNLGGRPVVPTFGPGPADAVAAFLPLHPEFVADRLREKFMLTFNPGGYLRHL